ncbi:MAG: DMT family transporter [Firmicutes bacterium]|nr:DMT family transporter [Bacillota bacterium]
MNKKTAMHLFAALTVALWALGYVMTRVAVRHFTVEAMSFLRYLIAALFLTLYAAVRKMRPPRPKDIPLFFLGGAIGFAVYVYAINAGSKTLPASTVSFLSAPRQSSRRCLPACSCASGSARRAGFPWRARFQAWA